MSSTDILFTPMHIRDLEIKNRFIMCPMEGTSIVEWFRDCKFMDSSRDFYLDRAKDGVGLFIPGMTPLRSMIKDQWLWQHPEVFEPVQGFMDELHSYGAKVFFQLGAGWGRSFTLGKVFATFIEKPLLGKMAKSFINMDHLMVAPDEGSPNVWMPQYKCHGLTVEEIQEYVEAYAKTAKLCKDNGVDGVEVHAVHEGYLMDQFTLPYSNHRTDRYGGSFENRYRFAVEVVKAIKAACGEDYPVSLRYSVVSKTKGFNSGAVPGENFTEAGRTMEESERAIRYLQEAGYDAFNCDNGTYDAWYWAHPPVYMPLNCNLEDVKHIKKFTDKPVFCAGRMQPDAAAEAISNGELDGVGIGRQFLCDEKFLTKLREGRRDEIRPCISCHIACMPIATFKGGGAEFALSDVIHGNIQAGTCSLNPYAFHEKKYSPIPAKKPKKISVIGGGISGMEFAIQASRRGHTVDLYEKTGELGGLFIAAAASDCKGKDRDLIAWYKRQLEKTDVTVHMNTAVKNLDELDAEEIVLATGSKPRSLPIPGGEKAVFVNEALLNKNLLGEKVAIIGGGLAGCELAYDIACLGKKPFIIEAQDDVIKDMHVSAPNSTMMRELLKFHQVPLYLETKALEIKEHSIVIENSEGKQELEADSFVSAIGFKSDTSLLPKKRKNVHVIGDASNVSNLKGAIWGANDLVLSLSK